MDELLLKIDELTKKVEFLEKQEKKRIRKRNFDLTVKIIKYAVIIALLLTIYININNKVIKPTKQKIDFVEEKISNVDEKIDNVGDFLKEKLGFIKDLNPFKK